MASANATYLYCLVRAARAPDADDAPPGLAHCARPRLAAAGEGLWLVVADAPLDRYGAAPIEAGLQDPDWVSRAAVAHEAVVEHFLRTGTVVPMKLLTLFATDASALQAIGERRPRIDAALARIDGCREYGVRIVIDRARAKRQAADTAARAGAGSGAGAAFLLRKRGEREAIREAITAMRARARAAIEHVAQHAAELSWRPVPAGADVERIAADAALLVRAEAAQRFADAVRTATDELAGEGLELGLTGPWPAYHFVGDAT